MAQYLPLRIEADGLETLDLSSGAITVSKLDLGDAVTRAVASDAPGADGSIDTTMFTGARVVTMEALVRGSLSATSTRWALTQRLRAFTNPRLRPRLYFRFSLVDPELMVTLRRAQFTDRWVPSANRETDSVVVQWVCPSGILESAALLESTVFPGADVSSGLEFGASLEFGPSLEFPLVDPPGVGPVVNSGDRDAMPVVRAYGPFGDEGNAADVTTIGNVTSGLALSFVGMGVAAGDYLEIDFRRKTILVNGLSSQSRYSYLSFPSSAWWTLQPGVSVVSFRPDTFSGNSQMLTLWRDAYN